MADFTQFAVAAAVQAWRDAGLGEGFARPRGRAQTRTALRPERVGTVMGIGIGGIEDHDGLAQEDARVRPRTHAPHDRAPHDLQRGPRQRRDAPGHPRVRPIRRSPPAPRAPTLSARPSTSSARAAATLVVAGGAEAAITEFAIGGFCRLQALSTAFNDRPEKASRPFDKDRDGFLMGEGAAALILEDWDKARARGAQDLRRARRLRRHLRRLPPHVPRSRRKGRRAGHRPRPRGRRAARPTTSPTTTPTAPRPRSTTRPRP